jgi:hypothetical protein
MFAVIFAYRVALVYLLTSTFITVRSRLLPHILPTIIKKKAFNLHLFEQSLDSSQVATILYINTFNKIQQ